MSSVTANSETAKLTPPITLPTSIPYPLWTTTDPSQSPTRSLSTTTTITANICSEFMQYTAPATPVSAQHKLAIVQDGGVNPIVFSIGSDDPPSFITLLTLPLPVHSVPAASSLSARVVFELSPHSPSLVAVVVNVWSIHSKFVPSSCHVTNGPAVSIFRTPSSAPNPRTYTSLICTDPRTHLSALQSPTMYSAPVVCKSSTNAASRPALISITLSQARLYCIQHIPGASSGWQSVDITPTTQTGYRAVAFDVVQDTSTKNVNLAVAVTTGATGSNTDLYTIFGLSIFYSPVDWAQLAWNPRNSNLGPRSVSTMQLSEVAAICGGAYPFVLVGTSISGPSDLLASDYVVSLNPSSTTPWSQAPLSKVASSVIQVSPGHMRLPFGHGVFTLFQDANYINEGFLTQYGKDAGNSCAFNSFPTLDAKGNITDAGTLVVILLRKLGQVARGFTTLANSTPEGPTFC
ncbi:hypothetical protein R3P38DRAFT_3626125 [Favolaschia claudopus]|uniref:Uncharacterized protein n=1 Tax=Favolaschia claudopus TaxID=2862362 RepID=A0AAW0A0W1_9AGAR